MKRSPRACPRRGFPSPDRRCPPFLGRRRGHVQQVFPHGGPARPLTAPPDPTIKQGTLRDSSPCRDPMPMRDLLADLTAALTDGRDCVYCAVVETRGSTPQKAGAAMLVFPDGSQRG